MTARTPDREIRPEITFQAMSSAIIGKNWRPGAAEAVMTWR
jgi:hypothetical protein